MEEEEVITCVHYLSNHVQLKSEKYPSLPQFARRVLKACC